MNMITSSIKNFFSRITTSISGTNKDAIKASMVKALPYGKPIEKIYIIVLFVTFIVLFFKPGTYITEDKVLILAVAIGGLFILRSLRSKLYFPRHFTIIYALLIAWLIITTTFSINIYNSLLTLIELFVAGVCVILGYDIIYGKYSRRWILNAFSFVLTVVVFYGIVQYAIHKNALIEPLGFPAYMGGMILLLLPFVLSSCLKTKKVKQFFFYLATFILLLGVYLTFSRFIYVLAVIEIGIFIVYNLSIPRKILLRRKVFIPFLLVIVLVAIMSIFLHFSTSGTIPYTSYSFADRNLPFTLHKDILGQAWGIFVHMPILGSGLGNYRLASLYNLHGAWQIAYYAYNSFVEMFAEAGIFGGLLFLGVFGYVIYVISTNWKKIVIKQAPETMELSIGIIAGIVLLFYYPILHLPVFLFTLFLFIGILLKDLNIDNIKRFYFGSASMGVMNGISIFFIVLSLYFFISDFQFTQIKKTIYSANASSAITPLQRLVKFNPVNTEYISILAQLDLSQNSYTTALSEIKQAMRYNKMSPYLSYTDGLIAYFRGDFTNAQKDETALLKKAPYADPTFYLLQLQLDQVSQNTAKFNADLMLVAKRFPVNADYFRYQEMFTDLGFSDALSKVYFELALTTKNQSYFQTAQKVNPSAFNVVGK